MASVQVMHCRRDWRRDFCLLDVLLQAAGHCEVDDGSHMHCVQAHAKGYSSYHHPRFSTAELLLDSVSLL